MNQITRIELPSLGALVDAAHLAYVRNDYTGTDAEVWAKEQAYSAAIFDLTDGLHTLGLSRSQIAALAVVL